MKVKICGIKTVQDAKIAAEHGADMIGFVFADSKRKITPHEAHKIVSELPEGVETVGVFVNPTLEEVLEAKQSVPLDYVQLHGEENPLFVKEVGASIKAFKVRDGEICGDTSAYPASLILLDAPPLEFEGGSGKTFQWKKTNVSQIEKNKLVIAGGLTPENVEEAVEYFEPFMVDVSSGVETNGQKDQMKIKQFIANAKGVDQK